MEGVPNGIKYSASTSTGSIPINRIRLRGGLALGRFTESV